MSMHLLLAKTSLAYKSRAFQSANVRSAKPATRVLTVRAALPVARDSPGSAAALRKFMMNKLGWDESWADSISGEFKKRGIQLSSTQVESVVSYLTSVGVPNLSVCNMASLARDILLADVRQLQAVVDYIERQGVTGKALVSLLETHPNLLTYSVSWDGKVLEKGRARASVEVVRGRDGSRVAGVSYWREGAAFETAPVAPLRPSVA